MKIFTRVRVIIISFIYLAIHSKIYNLTAKTAHFYITEICVLYNVWYENIQPTVCKYTTWAIRLYNLRHTAIQPWGSRTSSRGDFLRAIPGLYLEPSDSANQHRHLPESNKKRSALCPLMQKKEDRHRAPAIKQGRNEICPFGQVKSLRDEIFALQMWNVRSANVGKFHFTSNEVRYFTICDSILLHVLR